MNKKNKTTSPKKKACSTTERAVEYWHTGNIRKIETRQNETGTETFCIYYDTPEQNQKLWGEGSYKNGKKAGCWKTYYFNGQLETFWKYKNGVIQDGIYPFYDAAGAKIGENEYKNHKLFNGRILRYWPDGSVRESFTVVEYKEISDKNPSV